MSGPFLNYYLTPDQMTELTRQSYALSEHSVMAQQTGANSYQDSNGNSIFYQGDVSTLNVKITSATRDGDGYYPCEKVDVWFGVAGGLTCECRLDSPSDYQVGQLISALIVSVTSGYLLVKPLNDGSLTGLTVDNDRDLMECIDGNLERHRYTDIFQSGLLISTIGPIIEPLCIPCGCPPISQCCCPDNTIPEVLTGQLVFYDVFDTELSFLQFDVDYDPGATWDFGGGTTTGIWEANAICGATIFNVHMGCEDDGETCNMKWEVSIDGVDYGNDIFNNFFECAPFTGIDFIRDIGVAGVCNPTTSYIKIRIFS